MGVYYTLVNLTKKEQICFENLPVANKREIAGNPASAAIVSWYLLENAGDTIFFVGDDIEPLFHGVSYAEINSFSDKTAQLIETLVEEGILIDCGRLWQDDDEPERFLRDIRNAYMPVELLLSDQAAGDGGAED